MVEYIPLIKFDFKTKSWVAWLTFNGQFQFIGYYSDRFKANQEAEQKIIDLQSGKE